jgi:hypothetical protein
MKGVYVEGRREKNNKKTFDSIESCVRNKTKEIEVTYCELARGNMQTIAVENNTKKFRFTFDKQIV